MRSVVREGVSFDKSNRLVPRLLQLATAAMIFGASPATDDPVTSRPLGTRAPTIAMTSEPGFYQWQPPAPSVTASPIDYGEAEAAWRHALRETETALRVVRGFADDLVTPEVDAYFRGVEAVLAVMPEKLEPRHVRALAASLQLARDKFVADASSFDVWSKLSRALDPSAERRRVPERFVKRAPAEEATALDWTKADMRVQRAVRDFLAPDAHPRSSRT